MPTDPASSSDVELQVSINDENGGYPCPKDGEILTLIPGEWPTAGAWCPKCHTVWREVDEVDLKDLDDA